MKNPPETDTRNMDTTYLKDTRDQEYILSAIFTFAAGNFSYFAILMVYRENLYGGILILTSILAWRSAAYHFMRALSHREEKPQTQVGWHRHTN